MTRKKAPARETSSVGYGRPPLHSRFRKGQSGNPSGKRRQGEAEWAKTLMRTEARRLLTLRDGDKITRMTALQAVLRSQITCAAKGNVAAQRAVITAIRDIEAETRARGVADKQLTKDLSEMTDAELMAMVAAAKDDQAI